MSKNVSFSEFFRSCIIQQTDTPLVSNSVAMPSNILLVINEALETSLTNKKDESPVHEGKKHDFSNYSSDHKEELQKHVASVHGDKRPFKCESCAYNSILEGDLQHHITSVHEVKKPAIEKRGKICKSTWLRIKCQINDCVNVHIEPCPDRKCQALDVGLPLYKAHKCPLWHVRPKSWSKKQSSVHEGKKPFTCRICDVKFNKKMF